MVVEITSRAVGDGERNAENGGSARVMIAGEAEGGEQETRGGAGAGAGAGGGSEDREGEEQDHVEKGWVFRQLGVLQIEAIAHSLRTQGNGNWKIYVPIYVLSAFTSIEQNALPVVQPYYLSLFGHHSGLSTIGIMTSIAYAVGKPPMSKIMDAFGRSEGIMLAILLYLLGAGLTATAGGIIQFGVARVLSALGSQGLQLSQQVIVADTTRISSRGLMTSTISFPWVITTWLGPIIGARFIQMGEIGYRSSYLFFGVFVPASGLILAIMIWQEWNTILKRRGAQLDNLEEHPSRLPSSSIIGTSQRRRRSSGSGERQRLIPHPKYSTPSVNHLASSHSPSRSTHDPDEDSGEESRSSSRKKLKENQAIDELIDQISTRTRTEIWAEVWSQLDFIGIILLILGSGLLLLPLTLATKGTENWFNWPRTSCLIIGISTLIVFGKYEIRIDSKKVKEPIIPIRLLRKSTIFFGSLVGFWHFVCQYTYEGYFTSFLQVARYASARDAQYIQQSYIFTACISAIVCGLLVKWNKRYKIWVIVGILTHAVGAMLMVRSRRLENPTTDIVIAQIIGGFGGGFTTLATQIGVQSVVTHQDVGISTAVFLTITQIGGAVGSSLSGWVWNHYLRRSLRSHLPESVGEEFIEKIVGDLTKALNTEGEIRKGINSAYLDVQNVLNWLGLLGLLPCLISGLLMRNVNLEKVDQEQEAEEEE